MSASYTVDLYNTTYMEQSLNIGDSFYDARLSGVQIGATLDLLNANSFTNVLIMGQCRNISGQLRIQVVTSDDKTNFSDPTSGLSQFPTVFASGGIIWLNSGGLGGGIFTTFTSGQCMHAASGTGFLVTAGLQRPARYLAVQTLNTSTDTFVGQFNVGVVSQLKTTGSGGGFSLAPGSGTVSV